jgi:hypothetical protein
VGNDDNPIVDEPRGLPEQLPDDLPEDVPKLLDPDQDIDVTEPGPDGESIHHSSGGDLGDGGD